MRWASSIALAAVVVASSTSPARGASEDNNALCSQDFDSAEYLVRCDAAAWSLVATGRSYAWKFWYDTNDSSSRRYKILGGAAVSWPYDGPGRYFYQLTVSNGTPSGTQVYGPYAVEVADAPPAEQEPNPPTEPTPEPDNQPEAVTAAFDVAPTSPRVDEPVAFTAKQPADADLWYFWKFSDGAMSYSSSLTRRFANPGEYSATLTVFQKMNGTWEEQGTSTASFSVEGVGLKYLGSVGSELGLASRSDLALATINGRNLAWTVGLHGNVAVIDVTNPEGPTLLAEHKFEGTGRSVSVSQIDLTGGSAPRLKRLVAVSLGYGGMILLDAEKPNELDPVAIYSTSSVDAFRPNWVSFHGADLYVSGTNRTGSELRILDGSLMARRLAESGDLGDPTSLVKGRVDKSVFPSRRNSHPAWRFVVGDQDGNDGIRNVLYVGEYAPPYGVHVIDVSDPSIPRPLGFVATARRPLDICVLDHWLAIVDRSDDSESSAGWVTVFDLRTLSGGTDYATHSSPIFSPKKFTSAALVRDLSNETENEYRLFAAEKLGLWSFRIEPGYGLREEERAAGPGYGSMLESDPERGMLLESMNSPTLLQVWRH